MKKLIILLFISVFTICVNAQTKLSAAQTKQIAEKIDKCASSMSSMQCDFSQTKSMKMLSKQMQSKGVMYFKRPDKLRWEYTSPFDYVFIMNGDKVNIKSAKSTQNIDIQKNKMFRQITSIILSSITGGCLKNTADFSYELYKNGDSYSAKLYPKKKELKQIYKSIEIFFNPALTMVSSVKMEEKTGDVTTVKLNNVNTNCTVNDKVFTLN